jgi:hypothetical protein
VCFLTASEMYYEMFRKDLFNKNTTFEENRFIQTPIENQELVKQVNYMHFIICKKLNKKMRHY